METPIVETNTNEDKHQESFSYLIHNRPTAGFVDGRWVSKLTAFGDGTDEQFSFIIATKNRWDGDILVMLEKFTQNKTNIRHLIDYDETNDDKWKKNGWNDIINMSIESVDVNSGKRQIMSYFEVKPCLVVFRNIIPDMPKPVKLALGLVSNGVISPENRGKGWFKALYRQAFEEPSEEITEGIVNFAAGYGLLSQVTHNDCSFPVNTTLWVANWKHRIQKDDFPIPGPIASNPKYQKEMMAVHKSTLSDLFKIGVSIDTSLWKCLAKPYFSNDPFFKDTQWHCILSKDETLTEKAFAFIHRVQKESFSKPQSEHKIYWTPIRNEFDALVKRSFCFVYAHESGVRSFVIANIGTCKSAEGSNFRCAWINYWIQDNDGDFKKLATKQQEDSQVALHPSVWEGLLVSLYGFLVENFQVDIVYLYQQSFYHATDLKQYGMFKCANTPLLGFRFSSTNPDWKVSLNKYKDHIVKLSPKDMLLPIW
jgi:hypothetical protein